MINNAFSFLLIGLFAALLSACGQQAENNRSAAVESKTYEWKLVTSWPKNFPGLGRAPETFANYVERMSGGRLKVKVFGAGELVPGFEVFDAVSQGTAEMGHSGAYYWKGKAPAAQIFSAIPFGMNVIETNGWFYYGGGLELWREVYEPFGLIPFPGGNTGVQMAGWFNKEINSLEDFQGLKMRMPGLGGEVLRKVGGVPVALTGGEIFTSLQTGAIDATEWVGPYNDLAFGLHKAAKHYYYSGWHEPGTALEFMVNKTAYEALPEDLQAIVEIATQAVNQDMLNEYTANNSDAINVLQTQHGIVAKPLPRDVVNALKQASDEVIAEQIAADETFKRVYESYRQFQQKAAAYHKIADQNYYLYR